MNSHEPLTTNKDWNMSMYRHELLTNKDWTVAFYKGLVIYRSYKEGFYNLSYKLNEELEYYKNHVDKDYLFS